MNDFSELENELKKLRPAQPSEDLAARIESALAEATNCRASVSDADTGWGWSWRFTETPYKLSLGAGLAAAAVFLIFAWIGGDRPSQQTPKVAQTTPAPQTGSTMEPRGRERHRWATRPGELSGESESMTSAEFIPAGATHVLYSTRDEGLHFRNGYEEPVRRMRYQKRETLQWNNPKTGASLRVSYPSEEVVLIPVSGQ